MPVYLLQIIIIANIMMMTTTMVMTTMTTTDDDDNDDDDDDINDNDLTRSDFMKCMKDEEAALYKFSRLIDDVRRGFKI